MALKRYNPDTGQWEYLFVAYGKGVPDPTAEPAGRWMSTDGNGDYILNDYAAVEAYLYNLANNRLHIGNTTNWAATGASIYSIGVGAANGADVTSLIAIGEDAGAGSTGNNSVFIGRGAGQNNTTMGRFALAHVDVNTTPLIEGNFADGGVNIPGSLTIGGTPVALITDTNGYFYEQSVDSLHIGPEESWTTTALKVYSIGEGSAVNNTANAVIAIGGSHSGTSNASAVAAAAENNIGELLLAAGFGAGSNNEGYGASLLGHFAGAYNIGNQVTGVGYDALGANTAHLAVGIGLMAGMSNGGVRLVAIGNEAGRNNTGAKAIALGDTAGHANSGNELIALGTGAAHQNGGLNTIALGVDAARNNTVNALIALGERAGQNNTGTSTVALGYYAGSGNSGGALVALGEYSGQNNGGLNVVTLGVQAGRNNTANNAVLIGETAGESNIGLQALLLGLNAGRNNQGANVIGIGWDTGLDNTGNNGVFIGDKAGDTNTEHNRFILAHNSDPLIEGHFTNRWVNFPGEVYRQNESLTTEEDVRWSMIREGQTDLMNPYPTYQVDFRTGDHRSYDTQVRATVGQTIDTVLTHSRLGEAWFWNRFGNLDVAVENELRPWFDPATGEYLGMLSEYDSTNLLPYSGEYGNTTGWVSNNVNPTAPSVSADLGLLSAMDIVDTDSGGVSVGHFVYSPNVLFAGTDPQMRYAIVRYIASAPKVFISSQENGALSSNTYLLVDIQNGSILDSGTSVVSSGIRPLKDEWMLVWYRCSSSTTTIDQSVAVGIAPDALMTVSTITDLEYISTGGKAFQLAHVQAEPKTRYSTPIPTSAGSVSRSPDLLEVDLAATDWFDEHEGTLLIQEHLDPSVIAGESAVVDNYLVMGDASGVANYGIERNLDAWTVNLASTSTQILDTDSGFDPSQRSRARFAIGWHIYGGVSRFAVNGHAQETNGAPNVGDTPNTLRFHSEDLRKGLVSIVYVPRMLPLAQYEKLTKLKLEPLAA